MVNVVAPFFNDLLLFLFIFVFVALTSKLFHFSAEKHLFLDLSTINDDLRLNISKISAFLRQKVGKIASLARKRR
jgi:hypothetical protein